MIAKRIDRKPEVRDDYGQLGRYIAAAKEKGEKLDKFWIVKCDAGTDLADLDTALMEIEATRLAKPGIADKTYHLVVSFRPGEQDKLSLADLQDIERNFAEALGYGDHQRVAGTHLNTDNFHLHVAFNKVHPVTGRCITPRQDFKILAKVSRDMERKYGLHVDKGMTDGAARDPVSSRARDYEAKTWQQSFERHLVEHKADILGVVAGADNWQKLHDGLADFDMVLKKRGAGLVFAQTDGGKARMKASGLDRSCSLAALEERLGPFVPAQAKERPQPPKRPYRAKPLTRHPGTSRLWRTYTQQKKPGFLVRNFSIGNWKYYLLADAHRDPLALAIILTYKELLHTIDEATTLRRPPYRPPKAVRPAMEAWYKGSAWKPPAAAWMKPDLDDMNLRADEDGRVLFPFRDAKGRIWAVRAMDADGRSCDIGETGRSGLSHVIDPGADLARKDMGYSGPVVLTADCLTATLIHKDTAAPVMVAANDAGLEEMAATIRRRFPTNPIIIAAPTKSPRAELAAATAGGHFAVIDGPQAQARLIAEMVGQGRAVPVDPVQARAMGAFVEEALSPEEAKASQPKRGARKAPGKGDGIVR